MTPLGHMIDGIVQADLAVVAESSTEIDCGHLIDRGRQGETGRMLAWRGEVAPYGAPGIRALAKFRQDEQVGHSAALTPRKSGPPSSKGTVRGSSITRSWSMRAMMGVRAVRRRAMTPPAPPLGIAAIKGHHPSGDGLARAGSRRQWLRDPGTRRRTLTNVIAPRIGPLPDVFKGASDHLPDGYAAAGLSLQVVEQGGCQRSQAELVDTQGPGQRVTLQLSYQIALAHDDTCLRSAQQLVTGEEDQICASRDTLLGRGLMGQARILQCPAGNHCQHRGAQGRPLRWPSSASSRVSQEWVKPSTRKLLAWTLSRAPVSGVMAAS